MSLLINAFQVSKALGYKHLFSNLSFGVSKNSVIGMIGPNGAGKSTLLKILAGEITADSGEVVKQKNLNISYLPQLPTFDEEATIMSATLEKSHDPYDWEEMHRAEVLIDQFQLLSNERTYETKVSSLSGGWKKRLAIIRELQTKPDLFLLDEPTNHLDLEGILFLENYLKNSSFASITITHDRLFLQRMATEIIEINPRYSDGLLHLKGSYSDFLEKREEILSAQEKREVKLANNLRRETEWLKQGAKARSTKQEARIKRAAELKEIVGDLKERNAHHKLELSFKSSDKKPQILVLANEISKKYDDKIVIPPLDLVITNKTRLGLLGENGQGKSTLIRLLVGEEETDTGSIRRAENLEVAYFTQTRENLDLEVTPQGVLCPSGGDSVIYNGESLHVRSYLTRFRFKPDQVTMPVKRLSGGEQSRLLLAKLMLRPCQVLVLDEPTNDLDIETLDILQDVLRDFKGAIILVTHDRYFLDQVTDELLFIGIDEKEEKVMISFADLDQWESWRKEMLMRKKELASLPAESSKVVEEKKVKKQKKLSFKEQKELEGMEDLIAQKESELEKLEVKLQSNEVTSDGKKLLTVTQEMGKLQKKIEGLYERWDYLTKE